MKYLYLLLFFVFIGCSTTSKMNLSYSSNDKIFEIAGLRFDNITYFSEDARVSGESGEYTSYTVQRNNSKICTDIHIKRRKSTKSRYRYYLSAKEDLYRTNNNRCKYRNIKQYNFVICDTVYESRGYYITTSKSSGQLFTDKIEIEIDKPCFNYLLNKLLFKSEPNLKTSTPAKR